MCCSGFSNIENCFNDTFIRTPKNEEKRLKDEF